MAHHVFGVPHTINAANYVYFLGLEKALALNHPEAAKVCTGRWNLDTEDVALIWAFIGARGDWWLSWYRSERLNAIGE